MRVILAATLVLLLAACGPARPPWHASSGLWISGFGAGSGRVRTVICYAEGGSGDVYGDARPTTGLQGMTCQPVQRQASANGWTAEQVCTLQGASGLFRYEARREGAAVVARATITDPATRGELAPPIEIRTERIGACPQGWSPGEVMRLDPPDPDGRWRVVLPGQGGAPDRTRELATLPPELASRR